MRVVRAVLRAVLGMLWERYYGLTPLAVILLCIVLIVCTALAAVMGEEAWRGKRDQSPSPGVTVVLSSGNGWSGLYRFHDVDAGVLCYAANDELSCLKVP